MLSFEAWLVFLPTAALISLAPGPNNLLALTNGLRYGVRPSVLAALGRLAAFAGMILLAALGLAAVLATSELAFQVIKWAGVAYLLYLGLRIWRGPPLAPDGTAGTAAGTTSGGPQAAPAWRLARREFLVANGNPKAILVFTAVFPQFVDPAQAVLPQFAVMGLTFLAIEGFAVAVYALCGRQAGRVGGRLGAGRWLNRASGGLLIGAAGFLAGATRRG